MSTTMMTPEDVLVEAIAAVAQHGDTPEFRARMCAKLEAAIGSEIAAAVLMATRRRDYD